MSRINACVGEYHLVDFLGAGMTGEVYRAVHTKIGRVVAVKFLNRVSKGTFLLERFLNEARIHARLQHSHIAMLYDFGELDGQPCIIMEYVDGQTLADRIRALGPLPLAETLSVFRTIVEAIQYIHNHHIVHRDIKSNNIKINSTGQVKLLDFGIALAQSTPKLTMTGSVVGTPLYLSPEQIRGEEADVRSDIWALGVLLYEMVTGRLPFETQIFTELYEKIGKASFAPPSTLNPAVSREVENIITRCLRRNRSDRYQSAEELLQALTRLVPTAPKPHLTTIKQEKPPIDPPPPGQ